jgi:hypothetical protein
MGDGRGAYRVLLGDLRGIDHLEVLAVDGRIILKCIFKKWYSEARSCLIWLRIETGGGNL